MSVNREGMALELEARQMNEYLRRSQAAKPVVPDVIGAVNGTVGSADRLAAAVEEFARAAAQLPGEAGIPVMVTVGGHSVALSLTEDATDGLARWIHHAAGAAENQALIRQFAAEHLSPAKRAGRPTLSVLPGGAA